MCTTGPVGTPHRTNPTIGRRVVRLRRRHNWGPATIAFHVGIHSSTCWRILARHGINRLRDFDPPTGKRIRRYEKDLPGRLVHVDIKKIGRIPDGGGAKGSPIDRVTNAAACNPWVP